MLEQSSRFDKGGDEMGMSDAQFKAYLLEQLDKWESVLEMAIKAGTADIQHKAEKEIEKINTALKL